MKGCTMTEDAKQDSPKLPELERLVSLLVSKAPMPITPMRASSRPAEWNTPGRADWDMWRHMLIVTLRQAVALSLDIDPDTLDFDAEYRLTPGLWEEAVLLFDNDPDVQDVYAEHKKWRRIANAEYKKRWRIARAHLAAGKTLRLVSGVIDSPGATVNLPEFGAWALSLGWSLPADFPRADAAQPTPKAAKRRDLELSTRERETLLKLVIGMAIEGYRYEPRAVRSKAPAEIAADLAKQGIAITDDTVRKWLKTAANTVLEKPLQT